MGPFVFANLDGGRPPLSDLLGAIPAEVSAAGYDVGHMDLVERRDYVIECNWKVYVDNYLEGYQIPIAHPGLFKELDYDAYRVETFRYHSKQHAPVRELKADEEPGRDRRYVRSTSGEEEALYYWVFPNIMFNIYPDNMSMTWSSHWVWTARSPSSSGTSPSPERPRAGSRCSGRSPSRTRSSRRTIVLCEQVQRGLRSRSYERGRFSPKRENGVFHFQSLVQEFLNAP